MTNQPIELTQRNRALITEFARLFYTERNVQVAFATYVAPNYIQHNPRVGDGRDAALAFLTPLFAQLGGFFEIKRIIVDGNLAAIHLRARPSAEAPLLAVVDIYRIENDKVVEHWDVIQPIPQESANPHPMF